MEHIKELEECVDIVFKSTKTIKESAMDDLLPNTSDSTDIEQNNIIDPNSRGNDDFDDPTNVFDKANDFEEGEVVIVHDETNPELDGTKWIYDGPSERDAEKAECHSLTDDTIIAIDYNKLGKNADSDTKEISDEELESDINDPMPDLTLEDPRNESVSIEDAVMSVLEFAPAVAAAGASAAGASAAGAGAAGGASAAGAGAAGAGAAGVATQVAKNVAITQGTAAANDIIDKSKDMAKEDDEPVIECDEKKPCPKCKSSPCKCEKARRKFVTKKPVEESFEEMKTRKLTEAKEKGFSV